MDAVHIAKTILAMIAGSVSKDVTQDTGARPVKQIVVLIVSTKHVLVLMEGVLKSVLQDTGDTTVVHNALKIVTGLTVPEIRDIVLVVNPIGQEISVKDAIPHITEHIVLSHAVQVVPGISVITQDTVLMDVRWEPMVTCVTNNAVNVCQIVTEYRGNVLENV